MSFYELLSALWVNKLQFTIYKTLFTLSLLFRPRYNGKLSTYNDHFLLSSRWPLYLDSTVSETCTFGKLLLVYLARMENKCWNDIGSKSTTDLS